MNTFSDWKIFILILQVCLYVVYNIKKCTCPPDASSYVNKDGMIICNSCGGWIEGQY